MVDRNGGLWVKSQCVLDNGGVSCTWNSIQQWSEFTQCPEQSLVLQDPLRPAYFALNSLADAALHERRTELIAFLNAGCDAEGQSLSKPVTEADSESEEDEYDSDADSSCGHESGSDSGSTNARALCRCDHRKMRAIVFKAMKIMAKRHLKKHNRQRAGKLNQLRQQLRRASADGPTVGCAECMELDHSSNGFWSQLYKGVATPKAKKAEHIKERRWRWLIFSYENELFFAHTHQYLTVQEFVDLDGSQELDISFFNNRWKSTRTTRASLKLESQHHRRKRLQFLQNTANLPNEMRPVGLLCDRNHRRFRSHRCVVCNRVDSFRNVNITKYRCSECKMSLCKGCVMEGQSWLTRGEAPPANCFWHPIVDTDEAAVLNCLRLHYNDANDRYAERW